MLEISWSVVLFALILIVTFVLFALLHLLTSRLAARFERLRFTAPVRYAIGSGIVWCIFAVTHVLLGAQGVSATPLHLLAIYIAAGLPVLVGWQVNDEAPKEVWPGIGTVRLNDVAIAALENLASVLSVVADNTEDNREMLKLAVQLMKFLRYLRTDIDPDLTMQELRRLVMAAAGKELEK